MNNNTEDHDKELANLLSSAKEEYHKISCPQDLELPDITPTINKSYWGYGAIAALLICAWLIPTLILPEKVKRRAFYKPQISSITFKTPSVSMNSKQINRPINLYDLKHPIHLKKPNKPKINFSFSKIKKQQLKKRNI